jgi:hypothetical protein
MAIVIGLFRSRAGADGWFGRVAIVIWLIAITALPIFESNVPEANVSAIRRALAARSLRYVWTGTCASRSSFAVSS